MENQTSRFTDVYALAERHAADREWANAFSQYEEAIALSPENADAHFDYGIALANSGALVDAIRELNMAAHLGPEAADVWTNMGTLYSELGDHVTGAACLGKGWALDRADLDVAWLYASGLTHLGDWTGAKQVCDEALAIGGAKKEMRDLSILKAEILEETGQTQQAEEIYKDVLLKSPDSYEEHRSLAWLAFDRGELVAAAHRYHSALRYVPRDDRYAPLIVIFLILAADTQVSMCRFHRAARYYKLAVHMDPTRADAWFHLGNSLRVQGKFEASGASYCRALEIADDWALIDRIREGLRDVTEFPDEERG